MSVAVLLVFGLLLSGVYGVDKSVSNDDSDDDTGQDQGPIDTCSDGIDNDNDGNIDSLDAECDPQNPNYAGNEDTNDGMFGPPPP